MGRQGIEILHCEWFEDLRGLGADNLRDHQDVSSRLDDDDDDDDGAGWLRVLWKEWHRSAHRSPGSSLVDEP